MIAYDTGHEYIDEEDIGVDSLSRLRSHLRTKRRVVVQCPASCRHVHMFSTDNTAIVLMRRSVEDIVASQERIGWTWERLDLARYDRSDGVIAEVKYQFWEEYQKERIKHAFEIEYESLAEHPLWVPRHLRRSFAPEQTVCRDEASAIPQDARPRPHLDVLLCEGSNHDGATLVKTKEPTKPLNATGQLIWALCDGTRTHHDVLQALKTRFPGTEEDGLARDLDEFINDLVAQRFLQLTSDTSVASDDHRASET